MRCRLYWFLGRESGDLVLSMVVVICLPEQSALDAQIETSLLWRHIGLPCLFLSATSSTSTNKSCVPTTHIQAILVLFLSLNVISDAVFL